MIRVGVVEDRREYRDAICSLIGASDELCLAGSFDSMEQALEAIGTDLPHIMLVDLGLPGMSGIEGIRVLKQRYPKIATLAVTVFDDDSRIFEALCAGASGYILKKSVPTRLLDGIREVSEGGAPMSPEVARKVIEIFRRCRPPARVGHALTPHELRLLTLLVDGHSHRTAAAMLNVTVHTISFHLRQIYDKLQVHSKSEAVAKALRDGLIR